MPATRAKRLFTTIAGLSAGLLALSGCVAAPQPIPPGAIVLSQQCVAGFYTCVVPANPQGSPCSCPGLGAPSYGTIR